MQIFFNLYAPANVQLCWICSNLPCQLPILMMSVLIVLSSHNTIPETEAKTKFLGNEIIVSNDPQHLFE